MENHGYRIELSQVEIDKLRQAEGHLLSEIAQELLAADGTGYKIHCASLEPTLGANRRIHCASLEPVN